MPKRTLLKWVVRIAGRGGADDRLGHRLGGAHHRARVDRLVGRDQDEAPGAGDGCRLRDDPGGDRVVANRLERVGLHQRHVLVGGGVEDDVGLEALHHLEHPVALLAVGENRLDPGEVPLGGELAVDLEEVVLGVIEQDQQPRSDPGDLARELGADRAAGSGDQDDPVTQVGADAIELDHHGLAAEHVLDLDLAQLSGQLDAAAKQLEDRRQGAHADVALARRGDHLAADRAGSRRDGDDHLGRLELVQDSTEIIGPAEDLEPEQPHPQLARVVVDEADRVAELRVEPELADDHLAARAGADHEDVVVLGAAPVPAHAPLDEEEADHAAGEDEQADREDEVVDHHRARQRALERPGRGRRSRSAPRWRPRSRAGSTRCRRG